jgi:hypothetical protein
VSNDLPGMYHHSLQRNKVAQPLIVYLSSSQASHLLLSPWLWDKRDFTNHCGRLSSLYSPARDHNPAVCSLICSLSSWTQTDKRHVGQKSPSQARCATIGCSKGWRRCCRTETSVERPSTATVSTKTKAACTEARAAAFVYRRRSTRLSLGTQQSEPEFHGSRSSHTTRRPRI